MQAPNIQSLEYLSLENEENGKILQLLFQGAVRPNVMMLMEKVPNLGFTCKNVQKLQLDEKGEEKKTAPPSEPSDLFIAAFNDPAYRLAIGRMISEKYREIDIFGNWKSFLRQYWVDFAPNTDEKKDILPKMVINFGKIVEIEEEDVQRLWEAFTEKIRAEKGVPSEDETLWGQFLRETPFIVTPAKERIARWLLGYCEHTKQDEENDKVTLYGVDTALVRYIRENEQLPYSWGRVWNWEKFTRDTIIFATKEEEETFSVEKGIEIAGGMKFSDIILE